MCNSNVRQGQDQIEVVAAIHHNVITTIDDIEMLLWTRRLDGEVQQPLYDAAGRLTQARDELRTALTKLPKVER